MTSGAFDQTAGVNPWFGVSAFRAKGMSPLGRYKNQLNGSRANIVWTPAPMAGLDGHSGILIAAPAVTGIPELALLALMGIGLAASGLGRRRDRPAP